MSVSVKKLARHHRVKERTIWRWLKAGAPRDVSKMSAWLAARRGARPDRNAARRSAAAEDLTARDLANADRGDLTAQELANLADEFTRM
jgi:hypothetical protein